MSTAPLPPGFEALEPFAGQWALPGTASRAGARNDSTVEERQAFYDAASPLLAAALQLLDGVPLQELGVSEQRLMDLMLSLAHVALAVETQREAETTPVVSRRTMTITQSSADWPG